MSDDIVLRAGKTALKRIGERGLAPEMVRVVAGAPPGVYRDGGIIDYHPDLPFDPGPDGIVLFPHYRDGIIPGWLDKHVPWRARGARHLDNVLLVAPSRSFTDRLPFLKIPDRTDFHTMMGKDRERMAVWRKAADAGHRLADAFESWLNASAPVSRIRPFPG